MNHKPVRSRRPHEAWTHERLVRERAIANLQSLARSSPALHHHTLLLSTPISLFVLLIRYLLNRRQTPSVSSPFIWLITLSRNLFLLICPEFVINWSLSSLTSGLTVVTGSLPKLS